MIETVLALTLHLTTAADTCADRARLVAAVKGCSDATFTVPTADLFHMLEGSVGATRVQVVKKPDGCSLHLNLHVDQLPLFSRVTKWVSADSIAGFLHRRE